MFPIKLDRGQAASRYGKPFVQMMMRDNPVIFMDEAQDRMALTIKAMRENRISPFYNEWVYVIHDGDGSTKVGRSYTPRTRFNSLSSGSPVELYFYGAAIFAHGGPAICEKAIHRKLHATAKHKKGEWFEVDPSVAFGLLRDLAPKYNGTLSLASVFDAHDKLLPIFDVMAADDEPRRVRCRKSREEMKWVISKMAENA